MEKFIVKRKDGSIDIELSIETFKNKLIDYDRQLNSLRFTIKNAIEKYLDQYPGQEITIALLKTFILHDLKAQPENWTPLDKRIDEFIADNSSDNESDNKPYYLVGKKSVIKRWKDK